MKRLLACLCLASLITPAGASAACPPPPPAVRDIRANSYYSDAAGSIIDPALHAQYKRNIDPITDFHRRVLERADAFVATGDIAQARCTIDWLSAWAQGGALLGALINERGNQANYIQKWTLAGLAMASFKVRSQLTPADHALLDPWLKAQAERSLAFWDDARHKRNNHLYWTGLAVAATAAATDDATLWGRARSIYDEALAHIAADGTLEMEMARAGRALHYHNYALMPLAAMAELAHSRHEDWYARGDGRLLRLAEKVTDGVLDPAWFVEQTGKRQELPAEGYLGWSVLLADQPLRNRDKLQALAARGPFFNAQMGGNPALTRQSARNQP